jgi:hypothetical protein
MPRTVSTAERNAAKGNRWSFYRLEVTNPDGAWLDLGNLTVNGTAAADFRNTAQLSNDIDANTVAFSASVRREIGSLSLAPMRTDSPLNANASFLYAPALDLSRQWRLSVAVTPWKTYPTPANFRPLAQGYITTLDISGDPPESRSPGFITITGRGLEARLLRAYMTQTVAYATDTIENVLQAMVDRWIGTGVVPVYPDPASAPSYLVNGWTQDKGQLMPALATVAALPGANLRYRHDSADVYRFTLFRPNRTPTTPDYVLGPDEYRSIPVNKLDVDGVRNYVIVSYLDAVAGLRTITSPAPEASTVDAVAGVATFSASQAGVLAVDAVIVVDDVPYKVLTFDGTTGATLEGIRRSAGSRGSHRRRSRATGCR